MTRTASILLLACLAGLTGCQSFSSTMLNRLDNNSFVGNSNGTANSKCGARPFKGIPIALKVPSHLDVYIDEIYYMTEDDADRAALSDALTGTRILNVRTQLIKTRKIFTVDYKRPASGTLNLQTQFSDEQYFKSIATALQDTTIVDSANLLNSALGGTSDPAQATGQVPSIVPPTVPTPGTQPDPTTPVPTGPTAAQAAALTNHVRDTRVVGLSEDLTLTTRILRCRLTHLSAGI